VVCRFPGVTVGPVGVDGVDGIDGVNGVEGDVEAELSPPPPPQATKAQEITTVMEIPAAKDPTALTLRVNFLFMFFRKYLRRRGKSLRPLNNTD